MQETQNSRVRILIECALMVAIGTVLANIKIYRLPQGGSITAVSMLPFILVSFRHGVRWGVLTGLANAILQMLLDAVAPAGSVLAFAGMVLLDYVFAFVGLGLAVFFARPLLKRHPLAGVLTGAAAVCLLRFLCSFLSGVVVWGSYTPEGWNVYWYSFLYQLSYMLPETILTLAASAALYRVAPTLFGLARVKKAADTAP